MDKKNNVIARYKKKDEKTFNKYAYLLQWTKNKIVNHL